MSNAFSTEIGAPAFLRPEIKYLGIAVMVVALYVRFVRSCSPRDVSSGADSVGCPAPLRIAQARQDVALSTRKEVSGALALEESPLGTGHACLDGPSPAQMEISKADVLPSTWHIPEIAAFLQAWLFFGMLHEVLLVSGVDVDLKTFVLDRGGEGVITTAPLRQHLADMIDRGRNRDTRARKEREMVEVFRQVDVVFRRFMDGVSPAVWRISTVLPLDTVMSILILGESLINAATITLRRNIAGKSLLRRTAFRRVDNPLQDRMLEAGWCISTTSMLHDMLDNTGLYIASLLRVSTISNRQSHGACTRDKCESSYVNEVTYETNHIEDCRAQDSSGCPHISVNVPEVCSILRRGGTPAIAMTPSGAGNQDVELQAVESSSSCHISRMGAGARKCQGKLSATLSVITAQGGDQTAGIR